MIRLVFPELTEERQKRSGKRSEEKRRVLQKLLSAISDVMQTMHSRSLERDKRYPRMKIKELEEQCPEADRQVYQGYRQGYRREIKRDHDRVVLEGKYWVNTGMLQCGIPAFLHTGGYVYEYSTTCSNHSGRQRTLGKEQRECRVITGMHAVPRIWKKSAEDAYDMGIKYLTVYLFSTENWKRSREEVDGLMKLFRKLYKDLYQDSTGK